jgi:hypothetical protein
MSADDESWIRLASCHRDQGIPAFNHEMTRHARLRDLPEPPAVPQAPSSSFSEEVSKFLKAVAKDGKDGDDEA